MGGIAYGLRRLSKGAQEASAPAWCTDQEYVRNDPCPRFGSDGADIARASQLQHTVEDMNSRVDFGRPTFVST